jgi:uncharacterized protein with HEPN domain
MSRDDPQVRLRHMLVYAQEAVALMRDRSRTDLDTDRTLGLAILRCVEIVGEAAGRVPAMIRQRYTKIPWSQIIGMRNRLVHGYDIVDYDIVWSTVTQDLPPLIVELEKVLSSKSQL